MMRTWSGTLIPLLSPLVNSSTATVAWCCGLPDSPVRENQRWPARWKRRYISVASVPTLLDGDNVRHGLCRDLGFSDADRQENIRRVGEVASLMADAGLIVLTAFISPHRAERQLVKERVGHDRFIEIYVNTPLAICEQRDPKGLYKKARAGELRNFTGIDAIYEAPDSPQVHLNGEQLVTNLVSQLLDLLRRRDIIRS